MSEGIVEGGSLFQEAPLMAIASAEDPRVAEFLSQTEEVLARLPDESTVSRHVAAMVDEAGAARLDVPAAPKAGWSQRRRAAVVLAATLALSTTLVGFSYAGAFTFPQHVRSALSWLGLNLPAPDRGDDLSPSRRLNPAPGAPKPAGPQQGPAPAGDPGSGQQPAPLRGDQPAAPGGAPGDTPGGGGDRPDRPASPCPFPSDILGCDEDGGIGP